MRPQGKEGLLPLGVVAVAGVFEVGVCDAGVILGRTAVSIVITGQLLPIGLPPPKVYSGGHVAAGHVVCRMSVRSTSASVIEPIEYDPARWIEELCGRTMLEGINAGVACQTRVLRVQADGILYWHPAGSSRTRIRG